MKLTPIIRRRTRVLTHALYFESMEPRRMLAATPASVLTAANRQTLLDGMTLSSSTKTYLQGRLNAHDTTGFDTKLLDYVRTRTNASFFFDPNDARSTGSYIYNNIGDGDSITRADKVVNHTLPADGNQSDYTYNAGATIDWKTAGGNSDTLHAINRMAFWDDLSESYAFTGDSQYVNEMVSELASWSAVFTTVGIPSAWSKDDQRDWTLDMSVRGDQWNWSYFQVLDSSAWTKEANSLFLFKQQQQVTFLAANPNTYPLTDNRSMFLGQHMAGNNRELPRVHGDEFNESAHAVVRRI